MTSFLMKLLCVATLLLSLSVLSVDGILEEFVIRGPDDLNKLALDQLLADRKANPDKDNKDFASEDSPLMQRAKNYAVHRGETPSDESLRVKRPQIGGSGDQLLALPSPSDQNQQGFLTAAVTSSNSRFGGSEGSTALVSPADVTALAIGVSEDISMGAISQSGALLMGEDMQWLKFAEDKLKRDHRMSHQDLMMALGSSYEEDIQSKTGSVNGLNISLEEELMMNLTRWFEAGGGVLRYVTPSVSKENGLTLVASEDLHREDDIVSIPIKLVMCRISARNVLTKKSRYLGEELKKTFEKNEVWGLALFLLHEYYKEVAGKGSKWGPYLRTLRVRSLSTPTVQALADTRALELMKLWAKDIYDMRWFATGSDGPCTPLTAVCYTKPEDRFPSSRFEESQMRWAYWVVKQNAVRVYHASTGQTFLALVPFFNMIDKRIVNRKSCDDDERVTDAAGVAAGGGGGVVFDMDGSISISVAADHEEGEVVSVNPGNYSDHEFYLSFLSTPKGDNEFNHLSMVLPGSLPEGSEYHICLKMTHNEKKTRGKCKRESSDLMWKMKTLSEWRKTMNLPPRLGELSQWANRLHLYGDDEDEKEKLSAANQLLAGLPVSTDDIPAVDQLMLLGIANTNEEAMQLVAGGGGGGGGGVGGRFQDVNYMPQLYSAPDPTEDPEAQRSMEHLATLAAQVQQVVSSGNIGLNATQAVLNKTRAFFQYGVMPKGGLDELDDFLLKKIGMLAHCGTDKDMKIISPGYVSQELICAMRVHLMNESEIHVFCPADSKVFSENCQNVHFMNYTAISLSNELNVIDTFRNTLNNLLVSYSTTYAEDEILLRDKERVVVDGYGPVYLGAIRLRMREKQLLMTTLDFLNDHEKNTLSGNVTFQLELKRQERIEADVRTALRAQFVLDVKKRLSDVVKPLAVVPVDLGQEKGKVNLTLWEGEDIKQTVTMFCQQHLIPLSYLETLLTSLRKKIKNPEPLQLQLGVILANGERKILGIPENANATIETTVFCIQHDISIGEEDGDEEMKEGNKEKGCGLLQTRVATRLSVLKGESSYDREVLGIMTVDAPDGRQLKMVVRQGEQHDLLQFTSDFLEFYKMNSPGSVEAVANAMHKRLSPATMTIPISLPAKRQVSMRLSTYDNITAVVAAFMDFYEIFEGNKDQIMRMAVFGMSPGSLML